MISANRGRGRIGVLVPYTNSNLEPDLTAICPAGVSLHFTRISGYAIESIPNTSEMEGMAKAPIDAALDLLAPIQPDVVLYGCTSATLALGLEGDRTLTGKMSAYCRSNVITAAGAIIDALAELAVSDLAICSPYDRQLSESTANFFAAAGFDIASISNPDEDLDSLGQGRMTPDEVMELALKADSENAEAIVIACTDMRAVECIDAIESRLCKPVISSNQALMFMAAKTLGIAPITVPGILGGRGASPEQWQGRDGASVTRPFGETAWTGRHCRNEREPGELPT